MKKIYPKSIMLYFSIALIVIIFAVLFYIFGNFIINWSSMQHTIGWLSFVCSIIGIVYFSYKLLHIIKRKILLFENSISVSEDIGSKDTKLQYKIDVKFDQIEYIDMQISYNNSLNQYMRFVITPMPYIVLHLKDEKDKRINVYYYSKKQTIEIIDYIIEKKKVEDVVLNHKTGKELVNELSKIKSKKK